MLSPGTDDYLFGELRSDRAPWRLIPLIHASGKLQMAIDAWLLNQHHQGKHPSTLRFYTWNPPAISLGYHQHRYPAHWSQICWKGAPIDLIRRPTGGRAVLHQGDLTYAVITSGLEGSRLQVYQTLCEFLIRGWRSLGVSLQYGQAGRGYIHNPNCFGTATGADLVLSDGSKLIGSAQLYRGSAILQHGSIRLASDPELFTQVFEVEPLLPTLPLTLKGDALLQTVMSALTLSALECFGVELTVEPLSDAEWAEIQAQSDSDLTSLPAPE